MTRDEMSKELQEKYPLTIPQELYDAWQLFRQKKDTVDIANINNTSRQRVDRAINYGHCPSVNLRAQINDFFAKRYRREVKKIEQTKQNALKALSA